jgi:restriction system protein
MPLPTYDEFIDPLLRVLVEHPAGIRAPEAHEAVAELVGLSDEAKATLLPSGRQPVYKNRIGWAHDRLKRAGYSSSPRRALWVLTASGHEFAARHAQGIPAAEVEQIALSYDDPRTNGERDAALEATPNPATPIIASPEERIEAAIAELHRSVAADLLELIATSPPEFFEHLVLDLLHALGYGTDADAIQQVGKSGDGGIDGIITLDKLGFEKVYVQAKRWQGSVGRPEIQAFFGALAGHRASKGVFLTTSKYTREAREYASRVSDSLVLVDGDRLTSLMIAHGVGVSHRILRVAKVDTDYFEEA